MTPRIEVGKALTIFMACMTTIACPTSMTGSSEPAPKELAIKGTYTHDPSGKKFPEAVGGFRRKKILQYDVEGRVVSIGYDLEEPTRLIAATAYLKPLPAPPFEDELRAIEQAHARFTFEFDQTTILERGGHKLSCRLAGVSYDESFAHQYGPVSSYLLMCDTPPWRVKWRFTHLPTSDPEIGGVMKSLASSVTVPE